MKKTEAKTRYRRTRWWRKYRNWKFHETDLISLLHFICAKLFPRIERGVKNIILLRWADKKKLVSVNTAIHTKQAKFVWKKRRRSHMYQTLSSKQMIVPANDGLNATPSSSKKRSTSLFWSRLFCCWSFTQINMLLKNFGVDFFLLWIDGSDLQETTAPIDRVVHNWGGEWTHETN